MHLYLFCSSPRLDFNRTSISSRPKSISSKLKNDNERLKEEIKMLKSHIKSLDQAIKLSYTDSQYICLK